MPLEEIVDSGDVSGARNDRLISYGDIREALRKSRWLRKLVFILISSSLSMVPLAFGAEFYLRRAAMLERPWLTDGSRLEDRIPTDPNYRYRLPGLSLLPVPDMPRTNSWGYHDHEFRRPKQKGITRVVFVGDSMTEGVAVGIDETFPKVVESKLNAKFGDRFECINLGVVGYQALQSYATMKYIAIPLLEPDVIIYAFHESDAADAGFVDYRYCVYGAASVNYRKSKFPVRGEEPKPYGVYFNRNPIGDLESLLKAKSFAYSEAEFRWGVLRYELLFPYLLQEAEQFFGEGVSDMLTPSIPVGPDYRLAYSIMKGMKELAEGNGIRFMILGIPELRGNPCQPCDKTLNIFQLNNPSVAFYSLGDYVREVGVSYPDICVSSSDHHPNILGHRILGDGLFRYLNEHRDILVGGR